ncbi:MAG: hypothetical protein ACOYU0_02400 [Nitrospirota bacterium]
MDFNRKVNTNNENWSNFFMRRARVFFSGNAPNKDWTYYFHIQLEPVGAVNLHDAYVTWKNILMPRFRLAVPSTHTARNSGNLQASLME